MSEIKTDLKDVRITPFQQMISSCSGAMITALFVTPLDVVKIRMQAQETVYIFHNGLMDHVCCESECSNGCIRIKPGYTDEQAMQTIEKRFRKGQAPKFNNTVDAFMKITRAEGLSALWSGLPPTLVMAIPATVAYFTTYDILKYRFGYRENDPSTKYMPVFAGMVSRTLATCIISPLELLRTKMQSERLTYHELGKALNITIRECGFTTLMRGLGPTLLRDVPFSAVYWFGYEYLKAFQMSRDGNINSSPTLPQCFIAGATSGMCAATLTTPFDVIKTHRQVELGQSHFCKDRQITSTFKLISKLFKQNGVSSLFAGLTPRLVKVTPACAIMITSYEYGKTFFRIRNSQKRALEN